MVLSTTNAIGWKARDFALKGIDGKTYSLSNVRGPKGLREGLHYSYRGGG